MNLREDAVRLTRAAATLRMPYQAVLRLVLTGSLRGEQDSSGKWWVDATALQERLRESTHVSSDSKRSSEGDGNSRRY